MKSLLIALCIFVNALALERYRDLIPNGYNVPNPCGTGMIWEAVGHFQPLRYTSLKNPFGIDFSLNLHSWTSDVCQQDSDGDGLTNGQELGDPNCQWSPGANAGYAGSHPGICEPIGSSQCSHQTFTCSDIYHG